VIVDKDTRNERENIVLSNARLTSRTLTLILAGGNGRRLRPLTLTRPKPLVPFCGIFKLIDFTLSNCVNSNLKNVYLLTQHQHALLERYIEVAAANPNGPFCRKQSPSLMCLTPEPARSYVGTADAVLQNIPLLEREGPAFVLILAADHVYKMDYTQLLRSHADSGADVTVAAVEYPKTMAGRFGVLQVSPENEVIGFEEKPHDPKPLPANSNSSLVSMGIYVFNTGSLIRAVVEDAWRKNSDHDFGRNVIPTSIGSLYTCVYNFTAAARGTPGYWRDVGTIEDYYQSQMELLLMNSPLDPYNDALSPTYAFGEHNASSPLRGLCDRNSALDSVVSREAAIFDARIVRSVISEGVHVEASAEIESSVLLPGVRVGRGARIRRAVIDQNVQIPEGAEIGYCSEEDHRQFQVSRGGVVVVPDLPKRLERRALLEKFV
jgi:glucose-1-phosphate adenylyltransferase